MESPKGTLEVMIHLNEMQDQCKLCQNLFRASKYFPLARKFDKPHLIAVRIQGSSASKRLEVLAFVSLVAMKSVFLSLLSNQDHLPLNKVFNLETRF